MVCATIHRALGFRSNLISILELYAISFGVKLLGSGRTLSPCMGREIVENFS